MIRQTSFFSESRSQKARAERNADEVGLQKPECHNKADAIGQDKEHANMQLNMHCHSYARPPMLATRLKDSVKLKKTKNSVDIVRLMFDGLLIF